MKPDTPFFPIEVEETNFTSYPAAFKADNELRYNRRLGKFAGLQKFGVNITRIVPGGQSSARHAHSEQDEFVYVLSGSPVLENDAGRVVMSPGMCVGFPAGTGNAHRFLNLGSEDVVFLVIGDRSSGDEIQYPELDMRAELAADGTYRFFSKQGDKLT